MQIELEMVKWVHRRSQHADFKFPHQDGTGIARLIPHASIMCVELLNKLLAYNPDDRYKFQMGFKICIQFYNKGSNDYFKHLNPLTIVKHVN